MKPNVNFTGLAMGHTAISFNFDKKRKLEKTSVETPLIIEFHKIMNSREIRDEIVSLICQQNQKIVDKITTPEVPILPKDVTFIGIGMIGSALAVLASKEHNNHVLFVDEGDTKSMEFYRGNNCLFIKDEIVNGTKTIEIISEAQRLGHKTLGIITIMNENLPLTRERFMGKSGVDKTKLPIPCPIYSILTPQKIYKELIELEQKETADRYQAASNFDITDNEEISKNDTQQGAAS
ncbi:MAG: hypothetical protein NTX85_00075 [Candidatus Nomurabacteria bacterium]|nr:hypothetical protein [Candidatus Nomurabacteria bacterium]